MKITSDINKVAQIAANFRQANINIKTALDSIRSLYFLSETFILEDDKKALQEAEEKLNEAYSRTWQYDALKYIETL